VENAESGEKAKPPVAPSKKPNRFIAYVKRELQDRKAKKNKETPADRAVRVTATATIWMAIFTFVLAFVGIVTLIEIIEGGQDTHDLAVAAKDQAGKMKNMSDAADKIRQAAENMVIQDQRIADNAQTALDASNRHSKEALDAAIRQFREEQRAWVGPIALSLTGTIEAGKPIKAKVIFSNTGHTVATKMFQKLIVHTSVGPIDIGDYAQHPDEKEPSVRPFGLKRSIAVLFPNQTVDLSSESGVPDAEAVLAIQNGIRLVYVFGNVTYEDVFNRRHESTFCGIYIPEVGKPIPSDARLGTCDTYNYAD